MTREQVEAGLADGTLAGSVVTMDQAIRNVVRWTEATPAEAIAMAAGFGYMSRSETKT